MNNKKTEYPLERVQLWADMYAAGDNLNTIHCYEAGRGRSTSSSNVKRALIRHGVTLRTPAEQRVIEKAKGTYNTMKYLAK